MPHQLSHADGTARRPARGFSMPEMLVTTGTIVVLIALLLPAVGRMRTQSKIVICANNLRQIGEGMTAWKVKHDPDQMPPQAWRLEMSRYADFGGRPIFYCPEQGSQAPGILMSNMSLADGVRRLPDIPGGPPAPGDPNDPPPPPQGPLMLYFRNGPNSKYDGLALELRPGPWVKKETTPNGYRLKVEDMSLAGDTTGDFDYNDMIIDVTTNPDGSQSLNVVSADTPAGGSPENRIKYQLLDQRGKVVMPDFANRDDPNSFSFGPFLSPPPGPDSGGTSGAPGSPGGLQGFGRYDGLLGKGDSDYAINIKSNKVWGKSDKVLFLDYRVTIVADPASDAFLWDKGDSPVPAIARHLKQLNVLYADGSVRLTPPEGLDMNDPLMTRHSWEP